MTSDDAHLAYVDADGESRQRTLVSVLGTMTASHEAALGVVVQKVRGAGRRPVIIGSELDRAFVVDGVLAVELLPRRVDLPVLTGAEYASYLKRRWDVVLAKWQITEEITLGQGFDSFLAAQIGP